MKHLFKSIVFLFLFASLSYGQSFKIGVGGGLSIISAPDAYTESISKGGLGFSAEYHFNAKARFSLPVLPISIIGEVYYASLSGEESYTVPTYISGSYYNVNIDAETSTSILTLGVGAQYNIIPGPISPYVSASLLYNSFSEINMKVTASLNGLSETEEGNYGEKVSRMGAGIGAGVYISVLPMIDIDFSARYNIMNLTGKEDGEETMNMSNVNLTIFFGI